MTSTSTLNQDREFDEIERELLLALRTWVDEGVGRTPIAIALPKRDAYLLGQWGDQCGDVIFAWDHGYVSGYYGQWKGIVGGGSGRCTPSVWRTPRRFSTHPQRGHSPLASEPCYWLGPGIKKGYERDYDSHGYIHAADVVPTFCHILDTAPPAQSQGTVAHDLF